jgi:hypothetical protein
LALKLLFFQLPQAQSLLFDPQSLKFDLLPLKFQMLKFSSGVEH